MIDARAAIGVADVLFVTLDTLRYDVAAGCFERGELPTLGAVLGAEGWQRRHTPGSFTFAAHAAFFAGFLPTPTAPGAHPRLFAMAFEGSESIGPRTAVFDAPDLPTGLRQRGYHTLCVGGTGFFNPARPLGGVLSASFDEAHFSPTLGVTAPDSTAHQVAVALERLAAVDAARRAFVFLNVSALHQPNHHYVPGAAEDSPATQAAALRYVDGALAPLLSAMRQRAPLLAVLCSDHGTAYGEDGYVGHRLAHDVVWTVPYAERLFDREARTP